MADRFGSRLRVEAERWVRDGLLTGAQAEGIVARYPASPAWFTRPIAIFSILGGALIAAAIALFVAHNWHEIPRGVKLGGVIVLLLAAHLSGLALRGRGYPKAGDGVLVVGGSLLMVGIALIGQIYNLSGRESDALLLWWVLLLPAAYALPSVALVVLAWAGVAAWYWELAFDRTTWLGAELRSASGFTAVAIATGGLLAWAFGVLHGDGGYRRARQFLEQLGLLALAGALVALGFLGRDTWWPVAGGAPGWPAALLALLFLAAVAVALAAFRLPPDGATARTGLPAALFLLVLYLLAVVGALAARAPQTTLRALAYADWALLFAVSLALILYGARWDRTAWINWGVVFVGVNALARYVDLFGTMLQTSALFLVTGVFVLALGWALEKLRRRMTAQAAAARGSA